MNRLASSNMIVGCLESIAVGFFVARRPDRDGPFGRRRCFVPTKVDLTDAESTLYGGIASSRCMYEWTVTGTVHKVELSDEWDWIGLIAQ